MKKKFLIHTQNLEEVPVSNRGKLLPILENTTLEWAAEKNPAAHKATVDLKDKLNVNTQNKYFKYLRRLLELKLEEMGSLEENKIVPIDKFILQNLNIDEMRVPEHISCTSIGMYESCPRKYYYRYLKGIKFPSTSALFFGSCVDAALNFYFDQKIKGHSPPKAAINASFYETFELKKDEVDWKGEDPKKYYKMGPKVIDTYLDRFDSITNAKEIQTKCEIDLENGGKFLGYIDILEEDAIIDTKTANKEWETEGKFAKHKKEHQPKAYSCWHLEKFGRLPKQFRYQIVIKPDNEDAPRTQLIEFELKKYEVEAYKQFLQETWDDIQLAMTKGKLGFAASADEGPEEGMGVGKKLPGALCCFKYCEYAQICTNDGLKIPKEWVSKTKDKPGYFVW